MSLPKLALLGHETRKYKTTKWQKHLHDARRSDSGVLRQSESEISGVLQKHHRVSGESDFDLSEIGEESRILGLETFSRLYNKPEELEGEGPDFHGLAHDVLSGIEEFEGLRSQVEGDPDFSALAAASLSEKIAQQLPGLMSAADKQRKEDKELEDMDEDEREQKIKERGTRPGPLEMQKAAARSQLRKAIAKEATDTAESKSAMNGLMPGSANIPASHEQDSTERMKLAEKLRGDTKLRRIMELAGRLRRTVETKRKMRTDAASEEVVDIERGRDIARLLPVELSKYKHPTYKKIFMRDFIEGKSLQYKLVGNESLDKGPLVVLLDESGSMDGYRHEWARAVGVVAISMAVQQKRSVTVIGFNGSVRDIVSVDSRGEAASVSVTEMGRTDSDMLTFMDSTVLKQDALQSPLSAATRVATANCCGGTSFDAPLKLGLMLCGSSNADMIVVTDGAAWCSLETFEAVRFAKENDGLSLFGITIGGGVMDVLGEICDKVIDLDNSDDVAGSISSAFL